MTESVSPDQQAPDLRPFGYAPGWYTCKCLSCDQEFIGDKRAITCKPCAEKRMNEVEQQPPAIPSKEETYQRLLEFFEKHALGALARPSCLVCGRVPERWPPAIRHAELPGIIVCFPCRDAISEASAVETSATDSADAARYRFLRQPGNAIVYAKDRHAWGQNASGHVRYDTAEQLDAAVDAARSAVKATAPDPSGALVIVTAEQAKQPLPFRHWTKDEAVPYAGCHCSTCLAMNGSAESGKP